VIAKKKPDRFCVPAGLILSLEPLSAGRQTGERCQKMPADVAAVNLADRDTTKPRARDVRPLGRAEDQSHFFRTILIRDADLPGLFQPAATVCGCCGAACRRLDAIVLVTTLERRAALAVGLCHACASNDDAGVMEAAARVFDKSAEPLLVSQAGRA
jgi:hypothetical protein